MREFRLHEERLCVSPTKHFANLFDTAVLKYFDIVYTLIQDLGGFLQVHPLQETQYDNMSLVYCQVVVDR